MRCTSLLSRLRLVSLALALAVPAATHAVSNDAPKPKKPAQIKALDTDSSRPLKPKENPTRLKAAPATERPALRPKPGPVLKKQQRRPSQPLRPIVPGDGTVSSTPNRGSDARANLPELKLQPKPKINGSGFTPHPQIGGTTGKVFAPGGTIHLLGFHFGNTPGTVHLEVEGRHFPEHGNRIDLSITRWTDGLVEAKIPMAMTGPIGQTAVRVHLRRPDGQESRFNGDFNVPVETRALKFTDDAVRLVTCGDDGSDNGCHNSQFHGPSTINGFHTEGRVSDGSSGTDVWVIQLEDGWVFSELETVVWEVTGDDGDFMTLSPDFPKSETRWEPMIQWQISADDQVNYHLRIHVKRAKGAY